MLIGCRQTCQGLNDVSAAEIYIRPMRLTATN